MGSSSTKTTAREDFDEIRSAAPVQYKVYKERWLVLAVCCFLALSNAMQWISYSSLTEQAQIYYRGERVSNATGYQVSWVTNEIFQAVAVITGFGGMYITDNKGIFFASIIGTSLNMLGALIRLVSAIPLVDSFANREALLHIGSVIVAGAQAFFLVLPSKIAECWFADDQRAIANVLSFVANPGGVALGTVVPSVLFGTDLTAFKHDSWTFFHYALGMATLGLLPFVLSLCARRSLPPTPPSASSAAHQQNTSKFWKSIVECITNVQFLIQMICFALSFSLLWSLMMFMDTILTEQKYELQGYPTAVCAVVGTITSLLAGHVADRTKRFKEIIRFCSAGFAISIIAMRFYLRRQYTSTFDSIVILTLSGCLGAFSIPQFPIGVEMGVETTFPVLEATSSGLLVIFGQLWMFLIGWLLKTVSKADFLYEKNSLGSNWQLALDFSCTLALFSLGLAVFFMNPRYRRLELETSKLNQTMSSDTSRRTEDTGDDVPATNREEISLDER